MNQSDKTTKAAKKQAEKDMAKREKDRKEDLEKEKKARDKRNQQHAKDAKKKIERKRYHIPLGVRLANALIGIVLLGIPGYILVNEDETVDTILLLLSGLLLLLGILRIFNTFFEKEVSGWRRIFNFGVGIILIAAATYNLLVPDIGVMTLGMILAAGLALSGLARVISGLFKTFLPWWYRILTLLIGLASLSISGSVIVGTTYLDYTEELMVQLLAITFLLQGVGRLLKALAGLNERIDS